MGAPAPEMNAETEAEVYAAEGFTAALRTISPPERRKHASVYNYWLTIRGEKQFPPIRDLDPLEISDAGPFSVLLEMIGGGEDADIRHIGQAIKGDSKAEKVGEALAPSLLSCIATRLPIVSACREAFAFEDEFEGPNGKTKCWVTLLPFSATGTWIDYVYGFVSLDPPPGGAEAEPEAVEEQPEAVDDAPEPVEVADPVEEIVEVAEPVEAEPEVAEEPAQPPIPECIKPEEQASAEPVAEVEPEPEPAKKTKAKAGFSAKLFESLASVGGFYGGSAQVEPVIPVVPFEEEELVEQPVAEDEPVEPPVAEDEPVEAPVAEDEPVEAPVVDDEPVEAPVVEEDVIEPPVADYEPEPPVAVEEPGDPVQAAILDESAEGPMQGKLADVQTKADEARQAKLRSNAALYEGLSAAYDFALDAEENPEEYLKLVEARGLKIQLRSPMKPVVRLAFDGMCDDSMIAQLETVLAWALKSDLPRGTLAALLQDEGGIGPILSGSASAS